ACGPGNSLRTDLNHNLNVCLPPQFRVTIAHYRYGFGTFLACIFKSRDGVGSSSTCGQSNYNIVFARLAFAQIKTARGAGVLTDFGSLGQSLWPAGHHVLNGFLAYTEGGRDLRRVERSERSAGAGADVNQLSPAQNRVGNEVDGLRDLRKGRLNGCG